MYRVNDLTNHYSLNCMPASYPFPYHLLTSHGQRTSFSVLLPSVSATNLLLPVRSPSVSTRFFSSQSKRPPASFSRSTGINLLLHFPCLCPCLATIKYHRKDHCIYNSCFCLQTHVFVLPYLFK